MCESSILFEQNNRFPGIVRDQLDWDSGSVIKANYSIDPTPANLTKQEFYVSGLAMTKSLHHWSSYCTVVYYLTLRSYPTSTTTFEKGSNWHVSMYCAIVFAFQLFER